MMEWWKDECEKYSRSITLLSALSKYVYWGFVWSIRSDYRMLIITLKFNACNWWIMYFKNWTLNQQPTKLKNYLNCLTNSKNGSNWIGLCVLVLPLIFFIYSLNLNFPVNSCLDIQKWFNSLRNCSQHWLEILKFIRFPFWWILQHFVSSKRSKQNIFFETKHVLGSGTLMIIMYSDFIVWIFSKCLQFYANWIKLAIKIHDQELNHR